MKLRFDPIDRSRLHATFLEAFSDYLVDMSSVTEEALRLRCVKNNVDFEISPGVYDGERMVAFTLIGVDEWEGALAAFDAGTGVVKDHRGRGLAGAMMDHALPRLRERGVTRFLLEVIRENDPAIHAYLKAGFEITRELGCYALDVGRVAGPPTLSSSLPIRPVERDSVKTFADDVDWTPSWENGLPAIRKTPGELLAFGAFDGDACVGVVVYSPVLNWVMSLIVARAYRRRGIGTALVRHLTERLPEGVQVIKLLNVDRSDGGMLAFLDRLGCRHLLDQYEMARPV